MRPLALAVVVLLALSPLMPSALAQAGAAPTGAHVATVGNVTLSYWVGPNATTVDEEIAQGEAGSLWFHLAANESRLVAFLNVTPSSNALEVANGTLVLNASANASATANVSLSTRVADAGVVDHTYAFSGEVYREDNGTLVLLGPVSGTGTFTHDVGANILVPPVEPAIPTTWLVAGAAVLVVGGGALAYTLRQRNLKKRMQAGPKRSQVMREIELEQKLEKAKDPEQVQEIKQELRAQEVVREKRRELQILEAKRADALKTLDLLKKRHEAGALTKLQYDNMVGKKQADLQRIEAEIAQMEREDAAGGGAAA